MDDWVGSGSIDMVDIEHLGTLCVISPFCSLVLWGGIDGGLC